MLIMKEVAMNGEYVLIEIDEHEGTLEEFLEGAEIIIAGKDAFGKGCIAGVEQGHRGDIIRFKDGLYTWGYRVTSKLVKLKPDKNIW